MTPDTAALLADLALAVQGHKTTAYGQGSYDGDMCKACGWQGHPRSGVEHERETRKAALITAFTPTLDALRDAADEVERLTSLVNAKQSWIDGAKVDLDGYADDQAEYEVAVRAIAAERDASRAAHAALVAEMGAEVEWWQDITAADNDDVTPLERAHALLVATRLAALLDRHAPTTGATP